MLKPYSFPHRLWRLSKLSVIFSLVLLVLVMTVGLALAHGGITLDGVLTDWCFAGQPPGTSDSRTLLVPPTCSFGNELMWEDGGGDGTTVLVAPPVDIHRFATTGDPTNVYFAIQYTPAAGPPKHFQIAVDVAAMAGNTIWYDPPAPPRTVPLNQVGASIPNQPDYMIVVNMPGSLVTLWEATTAPGSWTPMGAPIAHTPGPGIVEIAIPWAAFTCAGCPPFGPGTSSHMTVMSAYDDTGGGCRNIPGAPCGADAENDIFSELVPGTHTTTNLPCPPGPGSTLCELADGSADAFIGADYHNPTAVELTEIRGQIPQTGWAAALGALILAAALALFYSRRKSRQGGR